MLDHLLRDRSGGTSKHEERRLNRILWSDDKATIELVHSGFQYWIPIPESPMPVVLRHEFIVGLSFDVLEGSEEHGISERVFQEGKAPSRKDSAHAYFIQFSISILPHISISALRDITGSKADLQRIHRGSYN